MKRAVLLSLVATLSLFGEDVVLNPVAVSATAIDEVAKSAQTNADLGEVLAGEVPSIDMSRRSGIANDVIIRGQKRDNISVSVDGAKVYGACPNRMDAPISHVLNSNIEKVEVIEGPYDVSEYGNLGGGVKITTLAPKKGWNGHVSFGGGSWNYKKIAATVSGGDDTLRALVSGSFENSDQYEDGDGKTLAQQVEAKADTKYHYKPEYFDAEAYTKKSFMTKFFINPAQNQELRLSYTANRSTQVLYPNTPMDADSDDSDIYNIEYELKNLTPWYKSVVLQYYKSKVDHPMSNSLRISSKMKYAQNHMHSSMDALRLKNRFDFSGFATDFGLEYGLRNWDGAYQNGAKSLDDVDTKNYSTYLKIDKRLASLDISVGGRYDKSEIRPDTAALQDNDYNSLGANIFATYTLDDANTIFFGFGQAQRVPDARELYFKKAGKLKGTPNLDQVTNREADIGYKFEGDMVDLKLKGFYSDLKNYIYINANKTQNIFENIDATIYGGEFTLSYYATDEITVEANGAYKKGRKKHPLEGQSDKDLADIAPLQGKIGVIWDYGVHSYVRVDMEARKRWSDYDADNGEQAIAGWSTLDMKLKHNFKKGIDLIIGVNNVFDVTYARSNTYADLTLVAAGGSEKMLLNEPGRYFYTTVDLSF